jgi:hypothetical protein
MNEDLNRVRGVSKAVDLNEVLLDRAGRDKAKKQRPATGLVVGTRASSTTNYNERKKKIKVISDYGRWGSGILTSSLTE